MKKSNSSRVEDVYRRVSHLQHVLLRPDTYVGSIENNEDSLLVYCPRAQGIVRKTFSMNWGLYKIFDEVLVNAADNSQRRPRMTFIDVVVNPGSGLITVTNDGKAIPIKRHAEHKVYVPEMIFGELLTGSNFDDEEQKTVGGRNGYGAKLANIFSKKFEVEVRSGSKVYRQTWSKNMSEKSEPQITRETPKRGNGALSKKSVSTKEDSTAQFEMSSNGRKRRQYVLDEEAPQSESGSVKPQSKNYVRVKFKPDLKKFSLKKISEEMVMLMHKRVLDIKAFVGKDVRVRFNNKAIKCNSFREYIRLHLRNSQHAEDVRVMKKREGFEFGLGISEEGFQQVSMVNGINTQNGGTHIALLQEQLKSEIKQILKKKHKLETVPRNSIGNHLYVFVNCLVPNPSFGSQTKETLITPKPKISGRLQLPDSFFKDLAKFSPLISKIADEVKIRKSLSFNRTMNNKGRNKKKLMGIIKLEDANWAGTKRGSECTLILTEGDSAKSLAMAGLDIVGRDRWGVFPLRGKFINVRQANASKIMANLEVKNIIQIMGLEMGKDYSKRASLDSLRYGRLMIMADQDVDGTHIKGLIINFLHFYWPSLLKHPQLVSQFITPLIKINFKKNAKLALSSLKVRSSFYNPDQKQLVFFSLPDFKSWYGKFASKPAVKGIKYYKGLGTSTDREARGYFSRIKSHVKFFNYQDADCKNSIEMAFSLNQVANRKIWLTSTPLDASPDYSRIQSLSYKDFVDQELIHFSVANLARSIPSVLDGLKTGKRKILFSCFKRNLTQEVKVAQLSGYVAEHSAYHHGEASLSATIVNMAQNFLGSNNVNLLEPLGQFGSRYSSKDEAASPRYIYTRLAGLTRFLFRADDDPILRYLEEEGQSIEPNNYLPVVPLVLVNGAEGIGSGWSTSVPKFNILDLIDNIRGRLQGREFLWMKPYYKHFLGTVTPVLDSEKRVGTKKFGKCPLGFDTQKFLCSGVLRQDAKDKKILDVLELPVGLWTRKYKQFLASEIENDKTGLGLKNFEEFHTRSTIHFKLFFTKSVNLKKNRTLLMKKLNLVTSISLTNLVLFDAGGKLKHYENTLQILEDFFSERIVYYKTRKEHLLNQAILLYKELKIKLNFIELVLSRDFNIGSFNRTQLIQKIRESEILSNWREAGSRQSNLDLILNSKSEESAFSDDEIQEKLLNMKIYQLTLDKKSELVSKLESTTESLISIFNREPESFWLNDLKKLEEEYIRVVQAECDEMDHELRKQGNQRAGVYSKTLSQLINGRGKNKGLLRKRSTSFVEKSRQGKVQTKQKRKKLNVESSSEESEDSNMSSGQYNNSFDSGNSGDVDISSENSKENEIELVISSQRVSILEENKKEANRAKPGPSNSAVKPHSTQMNVPIDQEIVKNSENQIEDFRPKKARKMVLMSDSESDY